MSRFIKAKFKTKCKQTGEDIEIGDDIYYFPGFGAFHKSSDFYKQKEQEVRKNNVSYE